MITAITRAGELHPTDLDVIQACVRALVRFGASVPGSLRSALKRLGVVFHTEQHRIHAFRIAHFRRLTASEVRGDSQRRPLPGLISEAAADTVSPRRPSQGPPPLHSARSGGTDDGEGASDTEEYESTPTVERLLSMSPDAPGHAFGLR